MTTEHRDRERISLIKDALHRDGADALVVSLPRHVLMLTGYYPVVGTSIAICTREGHVGLIAPEDENAFAQQGWADSIQYFHPASLDNLQSVTASAVAALKSLASETQMAVAVLAIESGPSSEPATYSAMNLYGAELQRIVADAFPPARLVAAKDMLSQLAAVKTPAELSRIRLACSVAASGFEAGRAGIAPGISEIDLASYFTAQFASAAASAAIDRQHAFLYSMSGPNSARAYYAYAHSRSRKLGRNDSVLVHCNSQVGGYWTDITRTYFLGQPSAEDQSVRQAVLEARDAAIAAVKPGAKASDVDAAARNVIAKHGFGDGFKHATGHGVGFGAIDAHALPRIHPKSDDVLEPGMVFNIEPAVYRDGIHGVRQCEMVAVTSSGVELLTPFQSGTEALQITPAEAPPSRRTKAG
ncbi:MAG TPA: Xaa-Pro peptidase family protein [Candidatus Angelobacter sp.]|nr:Xaa-Pro peptidase family protein [Candidatus Angelobacter sp.]